MNITTQHDNGPAHFTPHADKAEVARTFGADGKVVALRHFLDTAKLLAATRGDDTTLS
jgi:hypothetical protein